MLGANPGKGVRISNICRDWTSVDLVKANVPSFSSVPWQPPELGYLKLNFDGSCTRKSGLAEFGGVIRDHLGMSRSPFAGPLTKCSAIEVELHALWRVVLEMEELGPKGGTLEGD